MKVLRCLLAAVVPLTVAADAHGTQAGAAHHVVKRSHSVWSRRHVDANQKREPILGIDLPLDLGQSSSSTSSSTTSDDPSTVTVTVGSATSLDLTSTDVVPTTTITLDTNTVDPTTTTVTETDPAPLKLPLVDPLLNILTNTDKTSSSETSPSPDPATTTTTTDDSGSTNTIETATTSTDDPLLSLPLTDILPILTDLTSDLPITDLPTITLLPPPDTTTDPPVITDPPVTTTDPVSDPPPDTTSPKTTTPFDPDPTGIFPNTTIPIPNDPITTEDLTTHITIPTEYGYLTATTFVLAPTQNATTATYTGTDPDAPISSGSVSDGSSAGTTVTLPNVPVSIPMFISPSPESNPVSSDASLPGYTEISILFESTVAWTYVLQHADTAGQILAYLPQMIANSLNIPVDQVRTIGLQAFVPDDYSSENDLRTLWRGLIPTDQVATLSAMIKAYNSAFHNQNDPVAKAIADNVLMSYNISSVNGVSNQNGSNSPSSSNSGTKTVDNSRRNAIISVCSVLGAIILGVFVWWLYKRRQQKKQGAHQRISYATAPNYGATAADRGRMSELGSGVLQNPFMTEREREDMRNGVVRRNSFYAVGPDDESIEEETYDYMSQHSGGLQRNGSGGSGGRWGGQGAGVSNGYVRRPVIGQPISQPILRESSMGNW